MSICNRLDLQTLGSHPIMPKNFPIIGLEIRGIDVYPSIAHVKT